jgi:hypothetical protein
MPLLDRTEARLSLHGSLQTFPLADVLVMLAGTTKTGELRVEGDRLDGRLWLDEGELVAFEVGSAPDAATALFQLFRLGDGTFSFEAGQLAPDPGPATALAPLVGQAGAWLEEWRTIEGVIHAPEDWVTLLPVAAGEEVRLSSEQWRAVVTMAGPMTVHQVVKAMGVGDLVACRALRDLVDVELMVVQGPDGASFEGPPDDADTEADGYEDGPLGHEDTIGERADEDLGDLGDVDDVRHRDHVDHLDHLDPVGPVGPVDQKAFGPPVAADDGRVAVSEFDATLAVLADAAVAAPRSWAPRQDDASGRSPGRQRRFRRHHDSG